MTFFALRGGVDEKKMHFAGCGVAAEEESRYTNY
jgi:hypothetical protein